MASSTRFVPILLLASLAGSVIWGSGLAQPAPDDVVLRLGFAADAQEEGARPHLRAALEHLRDQEAEWLLYGGDTNYAYRDAPEDYLDALGWYGENDRVLFVYGNHDDDGERHRTLHPGNRTWWTWSHDGFTVVGLDTNRPLHEGSEQWEWLRATLDAHREDFVVVVMHISWWASHLYPSPNHRFPGNASAAAELAREMDVELLLGGHEHYYARWQPDDEGPARAITGPAEAHVRPVPDEVKRESAVSSSERTWMALEVTDAEVRLQTFHKEGEVLDAFAVPRDAPPAPAPEPAPEPEPEPAPVVDAPVPDAAVPPTDADNTSGPDSAGPVAGGEGAPGGSAEDAGAPPSWLLAAGAAPLLLGLMLHQRRKTLVPRARDAMESTVRRLRLRTHERRP